MTDLNKLAEALEDKPDSDGHCREAAALLRAAAGADVQGLMAMVAKYGHYRYASGFDYARKHSIDAQMGDDFAAEALSTLESALRLALPVWRPIEEAPKDGTNVIVMYMHIETEIVHNAFWLEDEESPEESGWWSYDKSEVSRVRLNDLMTPTHWMPLPPQPKGQP